MVGEGEHSTSELLPDLNTDTLQGQNGPREASSCGQWLAQMPPTSTLLSLHRPLGSVTLKVLMRKSPYLSNNKYQVFSALSMF